MNAHSYNRVMKKETINLNTLRKMEELLKVVADETRLKILVSLVDEGECKCKCGSGCCSKCECLSCMIEKCVSEIVEISKCSQSLVSHQLKVLKDADIVKTRRDGLKIYYSLKDGHIKELINVVKEHVEEK